MSFTLMAKVMPMNVGNLAKKMVLLKLADQASDDGICWPSYQTIAEACQVSRRTVIRHIQSLEVDGFLTITKTYDHANKKNFSNRYKLTLDRGVKLSLVTESHHPSDNVSISGDTVSPKPIIKPINEPIKKNTVDNTKKTKAINIPFSDFWNVYDKKKDTAKCDKKWKSLTDKDRDLVMSNIIAYIQSTPDKKFRKNPMTYLNGKCWLDEIDQPTANKINRATDKLAVNNNWDGANKSNIVAANTDIDDMLGA